jgi:DNA gyrase/topoisomerase IV subunit B
MGILDCLKVEKNWNISIHRFKSLGKMNPIKFRETTKSVDIHHLV